MDAIDSKEFSPILGIFLDFTLDTKDSITEIQFEIGIKKLSLK